MKRKPNINKITIMEFKLINFVKSNSFLYDKNNKSYRNIKYKNQKWQELANNLNVDVTKVKKRWKTLRDSYLREKKKYENCEELPFRKSKYYENLKFIDSITLQQNTIDDNHLSSCDRSKKDDKILNIVNNSLQIYEPDVLAEDDEFTTLSSTRIENNPLVYETESTTDKNKILENIETQLKDLVKSKNSPKASTTSLFFQFLASSVEDANLSISRFANLQMVLLKEVHSAIGEEIYGE